MTPLDFVIAGLALWRVSALLSYEAGPAKIFVEFREIFGITHDDKGRPNSWPDTWIAGVLTCIWCLSVNLALPFGLLWFAFPSVMFVLSLPFALSALAIIVEKWTDG